MVEMSISSPMSSVQLGIRQNFKEGYSSYLGAWSEPSGSSSSFFQLETQFTHVECNAEHLASYYCCWCNTVDTMDTRISHVCGGWARRPRGVRTAAGHSHRRHPTRHSRHGYTTGVTERQPSGANAETGEREPPPERARRRTARHHSVLAAASRQPSERTRTDNRQTLAHDRTHRDVAKLSPGARGAPAQRIHFPNKARGGQRQPVGSVLRLRHMIQHKRQRGGLSLAMGFGVRCRSAPSRTARAARHALAHRRGDDVHGGLRRVEALPTMKKAKKRRGGRLRGPTSHGRRSRRAPRARRRRRAAGYALVPPAGPPRPRRAAVLPCCAVALASSGCSRAAASCACGSACGWRPP